MGEFNELKQQLIETIGALDEDKIKKETLKKIVQLYKQRANLGDFQMAWGDSHERSPEHEKTHEKDHDHDRSRSDS